MMNYQAELQRRINNQWDELNENMGLATTGRNKEVREKFKEAAIDNVDKLYEYHQIDLNDEVLAPYIKVLKKRSGSAVQLGVNNLGPRFISNLFLSLPAGFRFKTGQSKHIIKRIEGNYQGDVELPDRQVEMVCRMVLNNSGIAYGLKDVGLASGDITTQEAWPYVSGERMMYTVELANAARVEEKRLGYVIVTTDTENQKVLIDTYLKPGLTGTSHLTTRSIASETAEILVDKVSNSRTAWETEVNHHTV